MAPGLSSTGPAHRRDRALGLNRGQEMSGALEYVDAFVHPARDALLRLRWEPPTVFFDGPATGDSLSGWCEARLDLQHCSSAPRRAARRRSRRRAGRRTPASSRSGWKPRSDARPPRRTSWASARRARCAATNAGPRCAAPAIRTSAFSWSASPASARRCRSRRPARTDPCARPRREFLRRQRLLLQRPDHRRLLRPGYLQDQRRMHRLHAARRGDGRRSRRGGRRDRLAGVALGAGWPGSAGRDHRSIKFGGRRFVERDRLTRTHTPDPRLQT